MVYVKYSLTYLLWFINVYKATNITTGGHHLVRNEPTKTPETSTSPWITSYHGQPWGDQKTRTFETFESKTTPEFDRYHSEQYEELTEKSHWRNSLSRQSAPAVCLSNQQKVQWTQGAPGSPREPGILDWNLHNSGIILAVSESGAHRIVLLVLGGEQKGTRLSFVRVYVTAYF